MASTLQPYQGGLDPLDSPVPRSADGRVPQCSPLAWSPDLRLMLDRVETAPAADGRWAASADGGSVVPQWQSAPPPLFQPAAADLRPSQLPRAKSGPSHVGGWYTSADLAMRWLRPPPKPARAASAPIAHDFEPQLASPIRKPARSQFQSSVRRQRPAPAGTTIRVVSSDWTPEGFERTVGVFAGRPQWSPLLRKTLSHGDAGDMPITPGRLRTISHPPLAGGADSAAALAGLGGARLSWPPASIPPSYDGGWASSLGTPQLPEHSPVPARHLDSLAAPSPAVLPPVPALPADYFGHEQAPHSATMPPRDWCAFASQQARQLFERWHAEHAACCWPAKSGCCAYLASNLMSPHCTMPVRESYSWCNTRRAPSCSHAP